MSAETDREDHTEQQDGSFSPKQWQFLGGELNKLAINVNVGDRQFAGVHYRSDHEPAFRLGEEIAVSFLEDCRKRFNEKFGGWSFTSFDGETAHIV